MLRNTLLVTRVARMPLFGMTRRCGFLAFLLCTVSYAAVRAADPPTIDYSRDIKPLLSNGCYACHGPDEKQRKSGLRLDLREEAIKTAIVPGKGKESPLYQRIISKDREEVMPPPHAKKPAITPVQAELIRRWIDEGARFEQHWAYAKISRPSVPAVKKTGWIRTPIDAFILQTLERERLEPAPEADKRTLIRRLSFDLLGLPPTPEEVEAFVADTSPQAYEKVVDRLLASKHFGERMAVYWLDVVRYADTGGYHSDNHRDITLYRDYVIQSFNQNKPFDQFTVEQLAGDLLPNATVEQKIASGYNRLLMTTEEGGAQPKEYTAKYAADRVRNVSATWLGATMGCAECHNHKYDPYTMKDFYSMAAFFADVQEKAVGRQDQTPILNEAQQAELKQLDNAIAKLRAELLRSSPDLDAAQTKWEEKVRKEGVKGLPKPVADALQLVPEKRNKSQKQQIREHYRFQVAPELAETRKKLTATQKQRDGVIKASPSTLITTSMANPRMVRILPRGNWLDDSGEIVEPDVPRFLGEFTPSGKRGNRLDLARWLLNPEHPLTARVFVNRLWKLAFGQGLVRNMEDLGTQGTPPTHPELLDWMAQEFIAKKWDVKATFKLILMSNTYRQSSLVSKELREKDPSNFWLARQNRFRLDAEFVRDNALAISGLLTTKVGGGSSRPYQPAGYWAYLNFPKREWQNDKGADQYRRGLYTYWCRSFLHPSLSAFDAPSREECTNERPRSSTPLQALVLLNDPTYVEAARAFAERVLRESKGNPAEKVDFAFRLALSRLAKESEKTVLLQLFERHGKEYQADRAAAAKLLQIGDRPLATDLDVAELAAWTSITRVILNLHETITRN